jgi:hypothetical protein
MRQTGTATEPSVNLAHLRIDEMHTNLDVQSANYAVHKRYPPHEGKSDTALSVD